MDIVQYTLSSVKHMKSMDNGHSPVHTKHMKSMDNEHSPVDTK